MYHITVINIHYNANLFDPRRVIFFEKFPFTYKLGSQSTVYVGIYRKTRAHNKTFEYIQYNILHAYKHCSSCISDFNVLALENMQDFEIYKGFLIDNVYV